MIDLSGLPDPSEREEAWIGDEPAYEVWCERMRAADLRFEEREQIAQKWQLLRHFGESAIDRASLERIASFGSLRELGAGSGYVSKLLLDLGADVIATDPEPGMPTWTPVAIESYESSPRDGRIPLLVWPFMNLPNPWLRSENAPPSLIVVSDVAPRNVGCAIGYTSILAGSWALVESRPVPTGLRFYQDYIHVWQRPS